jgi:hypothetical protein
MAMFLHMRCIVVCSRHEYLMRTKSKCVPNPRLNEYFSMSRSTQAYWEHRCKLAYTSM